MTSTRISMITGSGRCDACGSAPVHNAKRGYCRNCYARFLRSGSPARVIAAPGAGTVMNHGYVRVGVGGRKDLAHRVIVERALGKPLPSTAVVHHVDGNKANNANANLVVCPSESYHRLLHRRQEALTLTGNANLVRCHICGIFSTPDEMVIGGGGNFHRQCMRHRARERAEARRAA
jgi:hypothetical protein